MVCESIKVLTVVFNPEFHQMARCLRRSIQKNSPNADLLIRRTEKPPETKWMPGFVTNNLRKLVLWHEWLRKQRDGDCCVLIDSDTIVLGDLREAFAEPFDICYTTRPGRVPFNCGVVFVRKGARSEEFFWRWSNHNRRLVKNQGLSLAHLREFAGGNQWALNETLKDLEADKFHCDVKTVPCARWNCEQETWREFSASTAILHVKSWLRAHLLNHVPFQSEEESEYLRPLCRICRAYGW